MPFILIDKPPGLTSFGVIAKLRKITGQKKIGHAGTLDPFATGLLLVAIGRDCTRDLGLFLKKDKTYEAVIRLGATTPTLDPESEVTVDPRFQPPPQTDILRAITTLTGPIMQIPPMFSALKKDGQPLYKLARQGQVLDLPPRPVTIHHFQLLKIEGPDLTVSINCSSGTYIRALARDLGALLGTTGYLTTLRRTTLGPYNLKQAATLEQLTTDNWVDHTLEGPVS
jgi:tRNA pseudouridine55 synthase